MSDRLQEDGWQLRDAEAEITKLRSALEAANRQLWDKDDALTKLHRRISELEAALETAQRQLGESQSEYHEMVIERDALVDGSRLLQRRISELETALAKSQEVIRQNAVDFAIANGAVANLQHELGESRKKMEELTSR